MQTHTTNEPSTQADDAVSLETAEQLARIQLGKKYGWSISWQTFYSGQERTRGAHAFLFTFIGNNGDHCVRVKIPVVIEASVVHDYDLRRAIPYGALAPTPSYESSLLTMLSNAAAENRHVVAALASRSAYASLMGRHADTTARSDASGGLRVADLPVYLNEQQEEPLRLIYADEAASEVRHV